MPCCSKYFTSRAAGRPAVDLDLVEASLAGTRQHLPREVAGQRERSSTRPARENTPGTAGRGCTAPARWNRPHTRCSGGARRSDGRSSPGAPPCGAPRTGGGRGRTRSRWSPSPRRPAGTGRWQAGCAAGRPALRSRPVRVGEPRGASRVSTRYCLPVLQHDRAALPEQLANEVEVLVGHGITRPYLFTGCSPDPAARSRRRSGRAAAPVRQPRAGDVARHPPDHRGGLVLSEHLPAGLADRLAAAQAVLPHPGQDHGQTMTGRTSGPPNAAARRPPAGRSSPADPDAPAVRTCVPSRTTIMW